MYFEYFGLNEAPFRITPHTDFFFAGANRGATLEALVYAILNDQGIVRVIGEVGSGKTMLCRMLAESLPDHVDTIYLANPLLSRDEIIYALADELQLKLEAERPGALLGALQAHLIERHAAGRHVVALIDEAHAMPPDTLEQIRLLSNLETSRDKLLQIVLFGQPELDEMLGRPDMRQLRDRITHSFRLEPLVRNDVAEYIDFRMRAAGYRGPTLFSPAAIRRLAKGSLGLTRRINILADKSLLAAFAANCHRVAGEHVRAAIHDTDAPSSGGRRATRFFPAVGLTALLALLAAGVLWWRFVGSGAIATRADAEPPPADPASRTAPAPPQPTTPLEKPTQLAAAPSPPVDIPLAPARELAAATSPAPTVPAAEAAGNSEGSTTPSAATVIDPIIAPLGTSFANRLVASEQWREQTPRDRWFIQLATADVADPAAIARYLSRAAQHIDDSSLRVFLDQRDERLRIGVIYGEFPSARAARTAMRALPAPLRARGAYVRQLSSLG